MRKSTLITTIAMIVVVVVALSTATYAWFTSGQQSTAKGSVTTASTVEWDIQTANLTTTNLTTTSTSFTFKTGGATVELNAAMKQGLWSPTAEIDIIPANLSVNNSITTTNAPTWFSALVETESLAEVNDVKTLGKPEIGRAFTYSPDFLRITNAKAENGSAGVTKKLLCNVVIKLGSSPSDAVKFAAAATSFYVGARTSAAETKTFTNGYGISETAPTALGDNVTAGTAVPATNVIGTAATTHESLAKPTNDTALNAGTFKVQGESAPAEGTVLAQAGVSAGDTYLLYEFAIGDIAFGNSATVSIYTWLDGWQATKDAQGASFDVYYVFSTAPTGWTGAIPQDNG